MREFTKVSSSLHNSEKFRSLGRDYTSKYIYTYLLTCPHANSSGCFDLKAAYACDDLDMDLIQYRDGIETLSKAGLVKVEKDKNTVLITKWLDHNPPVNQKHAIGMITQIKTVSSDELFCKRFHEIVQIIKIKGFDRDRSVRASIDTVSIRYANGISTRPDQYHYLDLNQTTTKLDLNLDLPEFGQKALALAPNGGSYAPLNKDSPSHALVALVAGRKKEGGL